MATVTLKRVKKTQLLGSPSYKDAKTYFAVGLSKETGERLKVLTDEEATTFAKELNLNVEDLKNSASNYWRDYTFIMQGEKAELNDAEPAHKLALKVLEKDSRVAINEADLKVKSKAEYLLVKETEVIETNVARRQLKAEAFGKYAQMSEENLKDMLLVLGKNPKNLTSTKIKDIVGQELENNPERFLAFVNDKNFDLKVFINDMVQEGIVRKSGTSYVYDGEMIAHDNSSMLGFVKDPKNANTIIAFKRQLNQLKGTKQYEVE